MQRAGERQWKHVVDDQYQKKIKKERNASGWKKAMEAHCRPVTVCLFFKERKKEMQRAGKKQWKHIADQ